MSEFPPSIISMRMRQVMPIHQSLTVVLTDEMKILGLKSHDKVKVTVAKNNGRLRIIIEAEKKTNT